MAKERAPLSKPSEELLYWGIFRGQRVSLKGMRDQAPLSAMAAEGLVFRREAKSEPVFDASGKPVDTVIFIQKPPAK